MSSPVCDPTRNPDPVDPNTCDFEVFDHRTTVRSPQFVEENPSPMTPQLFEDPGLAMVGKDLELSEIFSDINLRYITRMIMEENVEDKGYMHQGDSSLLCTDGPEFDITSPSIFGRSQEKFDLPDDEGVRRHGSDGGNASEDYNWANVPQLAKVPPDDTFTRSHVRSSCDDGRDMGENLVIDESRLSGGGFPGLFLENQHIWQDHFKKGMEEANRFVPEINKLVIGSGSDAMGEGTVNNVGVGGERDGMLEKDEHQEIRGEKKVHGVNLDLEDGRSVKHFAAYEEEVVRSKMFDEVLLWKSGACRDMINVTCTDTISELIEALKKEAEQRTGNMESKGSSTSRSKGKKQGKEEVVDLRTFLIHCAQAVAADDHHSASELLRQIRHHSSVSGPPRTAMQKLALIFADGLEARLAGTGSKVYRSLMAKKQSAVDILKAYRLYIAACPFRRISHFLANQTILNLAKKTDQLHIVDFGINFGFQWPCLIQQLSRLRPGGPPKLRITGIDMPQPGFRPAQKIEETGRRLDDYCKTFKVPFEYRAIAEKWENIEIKDLKIQKDEVLIVNCLYRLRNVADESVFIDSPRDVVLNNIRRMNPNVFIHGVINGLYSAPFFVTRFREALFFFSSLFDLLETTIHNDHPEKLLIENEIFGREAINVIACEGAERDERPETYKQWQVRNLRAGFKQLPLNQDILIAAKNKVKSFYHRDFMIDSDGRWLLQGWKGRIIYALSTWIPTAKGF